jgi:hypothetical protein
MGVNIYNATSDASHLCWYGMGTKALVELALDQIGPGQDPDSAAAPPGSAIRTWFFQYQATRNGRRDWSTFDAVLAAAYNRGYKVIPVLINQWGNCEGWPSYKAGYKDESWYRAGYKTVPTSPGMQATYEQWVREVVTRYRNDPTILAWQLVNEAGGAERFNGRCSETASVTLARFAAHMGKIVKGIDRNHLLSLGTIGSGQCGAAHSDYYAVHAVPEIDLCEYHDYDDPGPLPGDQANGLRRRLDQCAALNKPLFVGELGVLPAKAGGTIAGRARIVEAKVQAQTSAGVVGILLWVWRLGEEGGSSSDDFMIGPDDPVLKVLTRGR